MLGTVDTFHTGRWDAISRHPCLGGPDRRTTVNDPSSFGLDEGEASLASDGSPFLSAGLPDLVAEAGASRRPAAFMCGRRSRGARGGFRGSPRQ